MHDMDAKQIVEDIIHTDKPLTNVQILDLLFSDKHPPDNHDLESINKTLALINDEIERAQNIRNNQIDEILCDEETRTNLDGLKQDLNKTQLEVMKLDCEIAFAKEKFNQVDSIRNDPVIKETIDILTQEEQLMESLKLGKLQQMYKKFKNLLVVE